MKRILFSLPANLSSMIKPYSRLNFHKLLIYSPFKTSQPLTRKQQYNEGS